MVPPQGPITEMTRKLQMCKQETCNKCCEVHSAALGLARIPDALQYSRRELAGARHRLAWLGAAAKAGTLLLPTPDGREALLSSMLSSSSCPDAPALWGKAPSWCKSALFHGLWPVYTSWEPMQVPKH